ncbi:MAG: cytochrome c [Deltaproteobacteria bacterium]|nr:cytochrome c [Deltaproteobacteria bacterium]
MFYCLRYMRHLLLVLLFTLFLLPGGMAAAGESAPSEGTIVPMEFEKGAGLFKLNCASCHGLEGVGTDKGPPLVHKIYEPGHHGDMSFYLAVMKGVRAHHWRFGDMPKVEGLREKEVGSIILYVRFLQRLAGIE